MSIIYVILAVDEVENIVFSEVLETSVDTLRYNIALTETVVKYEGTKPSFLYGKTTYTHNEICELLSTSAWNPPLPA